MFQPASKIIHMWTPEVGPNWSHLNFKGRGNRARREKYDKLNVPDSYVLVVQEKRPDVFQKSSNFRFLRGVRYCLHKRLADARVE